MHVKETTSAMKKAMQAFHEHTLIVVRKTNGEVFGPGHIIIMYGDVAFRMQVKTGESHFIAQQDIKSIAIR